MANQPRILVVEDDPDGQAMVVHILTYLNYVIDAAADFNEAWQYLIQNQGQYQVAIIDLALPGRDGWELLSEIRNAEALNQLPCIAVTAYHSSKTREEAIRAGFSAYFPKPIDATTFARELEAFIS